MSFENEWDAGAMGTTCGYFVPIYKNLDGFMDEHGNSLIEDAKEFEEAARVNKKKANDAKALDQYVAEHPSTHKKRRYRQQLTYSMSRRSRNNTIVSRHTILRKRVQQCYTTAESK